MTKEKEIKIVFVVGSGRSGSTLLRNILDIFTEVAVVPELQFFKLIYAKRRSLKILNKDNKKNIAAHIFKIIFESGEPMYRNLEINKNILASKILECKNYKEIFLVISKYFASKNKYEVLIEKTPSDIYFLDQIFDFFPDTKIIHIIRDGREVCASARRKGWGKNLYIVIAQWKEALRQISIAKKKKRDILEIKYEELVAKPKETIIIICDYLNISYISEELEEKLNKLPSSSSFFSDKKTGLYKSSNFYEYFDIEDQKRIESLLSNYLKKNGYKTEIGKIFFKDRIKLFFETMKFRTNFFFKRLGCINYYRKFKKIFF